MENWSLNRQFSLICVLALLALGWAPLPPAQAAQPSDDFIQGYASAVVAMKYPAGVESIRVDDGVVYFQGVTLSEEEQTKLHKMLSDVEGHLICGSRLKRRPDIVMPGHQDSCQGDGYHPPQ